jgi:FkbM family methyltransferase
VRLKGTLLGVVRRGIGAAMRLYRVSPLYPRLGRALGKTLAVVTRYISPQNGIKEIDGVKFDLDLNEVIDSSLFYSGTFEADSEKTIVAALKPGMTAIDVGANFGYHTFRMAKAVGSGGKVIAIEPTAWAYNKLQRNVALNDFMNIAPLKLGISDTDLGPTEVSFQSSYRLDGARANVTEVVPLLTLDTITKTYNVGCIDFIKIDVDGFEGKVIRGARQTLKAYRPVLFFEISPSLMANNGDDANELIDTLLKLGYALKTDAAEPVPDPEAFLAKIGVGFSVNVLATPPTSAARPVGND